MRSEARTSNASSLPGSALSADWAKSIGAGGIAKIERNGRLERQHIRIVWRQGIGLVGVFGGLVQLFAGKQEAPELHTRRRRGCVSRSATLR